MATGRLSDHSDTAVDAATGAAVTVITGSRLEPPPRRTQIDDDVAHTLIARGRILGEALLDDPLQVSAGLVLTAGPKRWQRGRRRVQNRIQRLEAAMAVKGPPARQHFVEPTRRS